MKLALSGGGTGGHVYPALSIACALARELPASETLETLYIASAGGAEGEIVRRAQMRVRTITTAPIRGRTPWGMAANTALIATGAAQARGILADFRPEVLLSTGGYASREPGGALGGARCVWRQPRAGPQGAAPVCVTCALAAQGAAFPTLR